MNLVSELKRRNVFRMALLMFAWRTWWMGPPPERSIAVLREPSFTIEDSATVSWAISRSRHPINTSYT